MTTWIQATSPKLVPYLHTKPFKTPLQVKASSSSKINNGESGKTPEVRNPILVVLEVPKIIWKQTLQPLSDFGFGKRSIWEGGVGLFVVSCASILALSLVWLRGFHMRSRFKKYQANFEFTQACDICVGTPMRIRCVTVGSVIKVDSSLKSIDATVELFERYPDKCPSSFALCCHCCCYQQARKKYA